MKSRSQLKSANPFLFSPSISLTARRSISSFFFQHGEGLTKEGREANRGQIMGSNLGLEIPKRPMASAIRQSFVPPNRSRLQL